jgi:hypothetical protein
VRLLVENQTFINAYLLFTSINTLGGVMLMVEGRCMKCKKQVQIKDAKEVTMKNGMRAMKGVCGACATKVFRILGKAK